MRKRFWIFLVRSYNRYLKLFYKMDIAENAIVSWKAHLDTSVNPRGIHIGEHSWVLARVIILAHDHCRSLVCDTYIGNNSIIGIRSIVCPGVRIGNECVIGAGSIVTKDIPDNCMAVGNPAKIIRTGIKVKNGKILNRDSKE